MLFLGDGETFLDREAGPSGADGLFPKEARGSCGPIGVQLWRGEDSIAVRAVQLRELRGWALSLCKSSFGSIRFRILAGADFRPDWISALRLSIFPFGFEDR